MIPSPPRDPLPVTTIGASLLAQIKPWVQARGGTVDYVHNLQHLWEKVYDVQTEDIPRIYICWNGATAIGGDEMSNTLHLKNNHWIAVIMRGHGFKNLVMDGIGQAGTPGSIEPFADSVEQVENLILTTQNITEMPPVTWEATQPMPSLGPTPSANVFLDGYQILFSTANYKINVQVT